MKHASIEIVIVTMFKKQISRKLGNRATFQLIITWTSFLEIVSFLNNLLYNQTKHDKYFYGTYGITRQNSSLFS